MTKLMNTIDDLKTYCEETQCAIGFSDKVSEFRKSRTIDGREVSNSIAILPMEGCDSQLNGSPGELTKRRYSRFAKSGAGLIWFEAISVVEEGRATNNQLFLKNSNVDDFEKIVTSTRQECNEYNGFNPILIAQLTHSGRYSKPLGAHVPVIATHNPVLDEKYNISSDYKLITDDELMKLEDEFVNVAMLAKSAGFDGVDLKACHGYLASELLSAYLRDGKYGGSYENRTRFLKNIVGKVKSAVGQDFLIAVRLGICDVFDYPHGFGVDKSNSTIADMTEPIKLVRELYDLGVRLVGTTVGNPYYNPHINRPYESGAYIPPEFPIKGVERHIRLTGELKRHVPEMKILGAGYSWLRQFAVNAGDYTLSEGLADFIGFGRQAFAYPEFANDIIKNGKLDKKKVCILCSKCSDVMRVPATTGCVIRDSKVYMTIYKKVVQKDSK